MFLNRGHQPKVYVLSFGVCSPSTNEMKSFHLTIYQFGVFNEKFVKRDMEEKIRLPVHVMEKAYREAAEGVLGRARKKRKPWISKESWDLGPVSRKARKLFGPEKPFLVDLFLKTERCIRLKLLV